MSTLYKSKPITPVGAVLWNGQNLEEVQALCPEVTVPDPEVAPMILEIPGEITVSLGEYVMKNVGSGLYSKLDGDVFVGLYMPQ